MAEKKEAAEEPAAESAAESKDASSGGGDNVKPLKLFLIINLVVVLGALGVSVFTFMKLSKPQVSDIQANEEGHGGAAAGHGAAPAGDGHGTPIVDEGIMQKKIVLNRFVINLANSNGNSTLTTSFTIVFDNDSDIEYAKAYQPKMRDVAISLISSKNVSDMSTVNGREELKEQMMVAFNSFFSGKAKVIEVLFTEFFLNTGA